MSQFRHPPRRAVSGVFLLDKPKGMTSNGALQAVRRLFNAEKAGHTGTLDPMATGLLPLCFGEATKFSQSLLDADKGYEAGVMLGVTTDTDDAEGQELQRRPVEVSRAQLEAALQRLTGPIQQIPPMHSALKKDGKPLYELARKGIEVERAPRSVCIHRLELLSFDTPLLSLRVSCSKGTYIRTLARDLGELLGCGAHLCALRRTATGGLDVSRSYTLETLETLDSVERDQLLLPPDQLLAPLPAVEIAVQDAQRLLQGQALGRIPAAQEPGPCRVYSQGRFLGLAERDGAGSLRPKRLLCEGM